MSNEATVYYSQFKGELIGNLINTGVVSFNAKTVQVINLPKAFALQVDAYYQYKEYYSFSTNAGYGAMNVSVQKNLKDKRTNIKLSANDVFYTQKFRGASIVKNYNETYRVQRDSRTIAFAITYKYGKTTVPKAQQRGTGADDEKQRAGKSA